MRRLGVYGENLPTKKAGGVVASDFLIAGLVGRFERSYDRAFEVTNADQARRIFGGHNVPGWYGWDAVNGFFANTAGVESTLVIAPYVGNDGTAIDAAIASANVNDEQGSPESILLLEAAYQNSVQYGAAGTRTGYRIARGDRFVTAGDGAGSAADTFAVLDSVADIKVGDIVRFSLTGGSAQTVYKKITSVDEATRRVNFTGVIHATANLADGDVVAVPGFKIVVFQKSPNGIEVEVDADVRDEWLTTEPEVVEYYAPNVFESSQFLRVSVLSTSAPVETRFPAAVGTVTYLTGGTEGTAPTTGAQWAFAHARLNDAEIRMIANPETTSRPVMLAMRDHYTGRDDTPKVILTLPEDRTETQLTEIGHGFQTGGRNIGIAVANWVEVEDPFNGSPIAPPRKVPNVGHVMGAWIWSIGTQGVHYIPSTAEVGLRGVLGVVGDQFKDDVARTRLARAGINVIQERPGFGVMIRNFFTGSTAKEFKFANGILMQDFIKISAVESSAHGENKPNTIDRLKADVSAIRNFLYRLWDAGSTGNVPPGETFGQSFRPDGSTSGPQDHFEVVGDLVNNPVADLEAGQRNIDTWFTYPSPAGSIKIGVGILLRG